MVQEQRSDFYFRNICDIWRRQLAKYRLRHDLMFVKTEKDVKMFKWVCKKRCGKAHSRWNQWPQRCGKKEGLTVVFFMCLVMYKSTSFLCKYHWSRKGIVWKLEIWPSLWRMCLKRTRQVGSSSSDLGWRGWWAQSEKTQKGEKSGYVQEVICRIVRTCRVIGFWGHAWCFSLKEKQAYGEQWASLMLNTAFVGRELRGGVWWLLHKFGRL